MPVAIFWGPPSRLFNPHLTPIQKTDLRPGIDMVGGGQPGLFDSVVWEATDPDLSEHVMEALKKRVDPKGLRNLVWRPQGATGWKSRCRCRRRRGSAENQEGVRRCPARLDATNIARR